MKTPFMAPTSGLMRLWRWGLVSGAVSIDRAAMMAPLMTVAAMV